MTVPLCPACQQPLRHQRVMCACGHPETSHDINRAGKRARCCHYGPVAPCSCLVFTEAKGSSP